MGLLDYFFAGLHVFGVAAAFQEATLDWVDRDLKLMVLALGFAAMVVIAEIATGHFLPWFWGRAIGTGTLLLVILLSVLFNEG